MAEEGNPFRDFEWYSVKPQKNWFDALERRYFINTTDLPLKIGFGHNTRRIEIIAIASVSPEEQELEALEGEVIMEE